MTRSARTAVVTGASHGIGLAVARRLARDGFRVLGAARGTSPELAEVAEHVVPADLATREGPAELVATALDRLGGIDVLVNNVGGGVRLAEGFLDIDDATWEHAFVLNVLSTVRTTRAALPSLVDRQGVVVNIGSTNARLADPRLAHYGAAKAALVNLTKSLSVEVSPLGVRVNSVSPGPVRTRIWTSSGAAERSGTDPEEFVRQVPAMTGLTTGAMIEPDEVASLVGLLASGGAPGLTGSDLVIDAGMLKNL